MVIVNTLLFLLQAFHHAAQIHVETGHDVSSIHWDWRFAGIVHFIHYLVSYNHLKFVVFYLHDFYNRMI